MVRNRKYVDVNKKYVNCNEAEWRAIYTVQFCLMWYAYAMPTTRIVSCKLNLQHPYDSGMQHKKCRRILKRFKTLQQS